MKGAYLRQTYRRIVELLALSDGLRQALKLQRVSDQFTLQKFSQRALNPEVNDRLLAQLLEWVRSVAETVAMDATDLEPTSAVPITRATEAGGEGLCPGFAADFVW